MLSSVRCCCLLTCAGRGSWAGACDASLPYRTMFMQVPLDKQTEGYKHVCVAEEWHRFPSSFFLSSPHYRLAFVKSGFGGLLPRAYSFEEVSIHSQEKPLSCTQQGNFQRSGCAAYLRKFTSSSWHLLEIVFKVSQCKILCPFVSYLCGCLAKR